MGIHWEVVPDENLTLFDVRFGAVRGHREEIVDAIENAGRRAAMYAFDHAPVDTGRLRNAIYHTKAKYRPGGAGGGGTYVVEVGVHPIKAPHGMWVLEGTGIFGARRRSIYPARGRGAASVLFKQDAQNPYIEHRRDDGKLRQTRGKGQFLTFQKEGEPRRFRRSVSGQPAQTEWWIGAQAIANEIIRQRVQRS